MAMGNERKLRCKVRPGMFRDEFVAGFSIVDSRGNDVEAECWTYVGSVEMTNRPSKSKEAEAALRVYCLSRKKGFAEVVLPQPTFQNGTNVVVRDRAIIG